VITKSTHQAKKFSHINQINILIVDDDVEEIVTSLSKALRSNDQYRVHIAKSATDALNINSSLLPELVLLDMCPSKNYNVELASKLKQTNPTGIIIVMTASRESELVVRALRAKVSDYIFKPINPKNLLILIKQHLEKHALESELKTHAQLHWATLESIDEGVLVVNQHGETISYNSQFSQLWRLPEDLLKFRDDDLLLSKVLVQLVNPNAFLDKVKQLYQSEAVEQDEIHFKDGRIFARYTRPLIQDTLLIGRVWAFRDITKQRLAKQALQQSEEKYRSLFNDAMDMIHIFNSDGKILDANAIELKKMQYSRQEYVGKQIEDVIHPEQLGAFLCAMKNVFKGENLVKFETIMVSRDGKEINVEVDSVPYTVDGQVIYARSIIRDVTQRKQTELELTKYRNQLEQLVEQRTAELIASNQDLESFCYSVSHDLRTPLRAIAGFGNALLEDGKDRLNLDQMDYLNRIRLAAKRMSIMIDDLLQLSRVISHELIRDKVDLRELAVEVINELKAAHPGGNVKIDIQQQLIADGDRRLIRQVLSNLIGNAWKYSAKSTQPHICMGREKRNGHWVFFVRDNGVGLDMQYADKLFGVFQRLHQQSEFEGTGVGLATVKRIINRHGGRVWAESSLGNGACFLFTLSRNSL